MPLPRIATMPRSRPAALEMKGWAGGLNSRDDAIRIDDDELSAGKNALIEPKGVIAKRPGREMHHNFIGTTTEIKGLFNFVNSAGTQAQLAVYDTDIYYPSSNIWTGLGQSLTTDLAADGAYYESTDKFYVTNGTDDVVVITSTASVTTDASFKKGKYVVAFQNRLLVANVSGQEDYVWYSDLSSDSFSASSYFRVPGGAITGLSVAPALKAVLIFTKRGIFRLQNFTFDGVAAGPEAVIPVSTTVGCIADRTIAEVNSLTYFLGQDTKDVAQVYVTDGSQVIPIGDKIQTDLSALSAADLDKAAGIHDGRFYRLSVSKDGTKNDSEYLYDSIRKNWTTRWDKGYSCYMISETSGAQEVYGGDPTNGIVHKLTTTNAYDEDYDQSYLSGQDTDEQLAGATTTRVAQSFKLSVDSGKTLQVGGALLYLKKVSGTTTELTVRVETDSSGEPSGTLADANLTTTISAFTDTSYVWKTAEFSTVGTLSGNTTYWLVLQHTTEGSGNSVYAWGSDSSSPSYSDGNHATYASGSWTTNTDTDQIFGILTRSEIDFRAETKAYDFGRQGLEKWLKRLYIETSSGGTLEVGINNLRGADYAGEVLDLGTTGADWGGSSITWGGGNKYGEQDTRVTNWLNADPSVARGRFHKFCFKSSDTNTKKIYGLTVYFRTARKLA